MNRRLVTTGVSAVVAFVVLGVVALAPRPPPFEAHAAWVDREWQGNGPWCLPTATAAVARVQGYGDVDARSLAREAKVDPEGIAWTEMVRVLRARGIDAQLIYPQVPALKGLLEYGPVVISQAGDRADHAIVLEAWQPLYSRWRVMDPANPAAQYIHTGTLEPAFEQSLRHAIVILQKR